MTYVVEYQGNLRTKSYDPGKKWQILTDAPVDNQGIGEEVSPTDLVVVAAASCALTLMGIEADRLNVDLLGCYIRAEKTIVKDPYRRIGSITLKIYAPKTYTAAITQKLENAALHCPVHKSLDPKVAIKMEFFWGQTA